MCMLLQPLIFIPTDGWIQLSLSFFFLFSIRRFVLIFEWKILFGFFASCFSAFFFSLCNGSKTKKKWINLIRTSAEDRIRFYRRSWYDSGRDQRISKEKKEITFRELKYKKKKNILKWECFFICWAEHCVNTVNGRSIRTLLQVPKGSANSGIGKQITRAQHGWSNDTKWKRIAHITVNS
jgi:hypothetical protein